MCKMVVEKLVLYCDYNLYKILDTDLFPDIDYVDFVDSVVDSKAEDFSTRIRITTNTITAQPLAISAKG